MHYSAISILNIMATCVQTTGAHAETHVEAHVEAHAEAHMEAHAEAHVGAHAEEKPQVESLTSWMEKNKITQSFLCYRYAAKYGMDNGLTPEQTTTDFLALGDRSANYCKILADRYKRWMKDRQSNKIDQLDEYCDDVCYHPDEKLFDQMKAVLKCFIESNLALQ